MKSTRMHSLLGATLAVASLACSGLAADPLPGHLPRANYQIELEITPKDGTPFRYKVVTAAERVQASFLTPATAGDENEAPTITKFEAEFEPAELNRIYVRGFRIGQQVPVVTGTMRAGGVGPVREPRGVDPAVGPEAAGGAGGDRPRAVERRRPRETGDGAEPPPLAENLQGGRNPPRFLAGPAGPIRSIQYMDVGVISSVVLTLGKPLVVTEDATQRVTLSIRRLDD